MNCLVCYEHDESIVPAIAPNEYGQPLCEECIRRDAGAVTWECPSCRNERPIPAKAWLEGDYRCVPCAARESRAKADADAGGYRR